MKELNGYFTRFDKRSAGDEFLDRVENRVRQRGRKCFIDLLTLVTSMLVTDVGDKMCW